MADISKITLPSGNTYEIKDEVARQMIAGGVSFIIAWDGTSTPVVGDIPAGVVVTYNGTSYTGTLSVANAEAGAFYLVKSSTQIETLDVYDEYAVIGSGANRRWEKIGDTQLDLSSLGALAYKDNVTLNKGAGDNVLGEATTFTAGSSSVTFSGGTTDTFVKSYPGTTSKLSTTTVPNVTGNSDVSIPNVTNAGSAASWSFAMGTGDDAETLIISGANGSAPTLGTALSASKVTLGTAITVATGGLAANGGGSSVMTGLGTATTGTAVTGVGTGTAAGQTITVGTNDKVKVAVYDDLSTSVS